MSPPRDVSVVLPAYNEAGTLEETVSVTLEALGGFLPPDGFEVIIAEDGCEDDTAAIAERLASADGRVRHLHSDERLGRGEALERAFRAASGGVLVYLDTDRATDMRHLEELVESVLHGPYHVATGSRWLPEQVADRPLERAVASRGYNGLVRLFLRSELRDHQCGFKAFDHQALLEVLDEVEDGHWFWDTEVLVKAQRAGYRVKEFPVEWEPKGDSKVDLVHDVAEMGSQILSTWWSLGVQPRITRRVAATAGAFLTVAAVGLMLLYLDPRAVFEAVVEADLGLIAAAAATYTLSWPIRGQRYRDILDSLGFRERLGVLTGAVFISQTGNLVFPTRAGDALRAYVVKTRRSVPYPTGFASLAVERVLDLLTITVLATGVLALLSATGRVAPLRRVVATAGPAGQTALWVATGVSITTVCVVAAAGLAGRTDSSRFPFVGRGSSTLGSGRLAGLLRGFARDFRQPIDSPATFGRLVVTSLAVWLLDIATALLVVLAIGVPLDAGLLLGAGVLAVSVGNLAKVLPLSPGGIGLYEAAFTLLLVGLTPITPPVAFSAALVDHAVKNAVTVIGGAASMGLLNVSLTTGAEEGKRAKRTGSASRPSIRGD